MDRAERKKLTELLKSIQVLQIKIRRDKKDIGDLKKEEFNESTFHSTRRPQGPQLDDEIRQKQKIANRERAMLRTEKLLEKLESAIQELGAIDLIGSDILECRYLKGQSLEQIARSLYCSKSTVEKKCRRATEQLSILIGGSDALAELFNK